MPTRTAVQTRPGEGALTVSQLRLAFAWCTRGSTTKSRGTT